MVGLGKKIKMINNIQNKAKQSFIELGYPDRKSEDWKYTNTDKFSQCIPYNRDIPFNDKVTKKLAISILETLADIIKLNARSASSFKRFFLSKTF